MKVSEPYLTVRINLEKSSSNDEMKLICVEYSGAPLPEIVKHFYVAAGYLGGVEQRNLGYTNILCPQR